MNRLSAVTQTVEQLERANALLTDSLFRLALAEKDDSERDKVYAAMEEIGLLLTRARTASLKDVEKSFDEHRSQFAGVVDDLEKARKAPERVENVMLAVGKVLDVGKALIGLG